MRRQTRGGPIAAGSGRYARLDPLALPVRFVAEDAVADGRIRMIEIDRERVLVRRTVRGMRIRLNLPLSAFRGVAVRLLSARAGQEAKIVTVVLEHPDPALSIPLYAERGTDDVIAEWQLWAKALRQKLLIAGRDGTLIAPPMIGSVWFRAVVPRRRRRTALRRRRPLIFKFRAQTRLTADAVVHRGEREIIAPE